MNLKRPFMVMTRAAALLIAACASAAAPALPPLRAGCEYDYEPFCLVRADGQADGFSVELLREAARTMGREITFKTAPWPELKKDLEEGRLDVLPMVAHTPEREDHFDFTFPYLSTHGAIVVRKDNTGIARAEDLKGKHVAVLEEDVAHEYLRTANVGALIDPLPSFAQALQELAEGKHDAVVVQRLLAFQLMKSGKLTNLKIAGNLIAEYSQKICFAVRKGDKATLDLLNEGLSVVIANDTFHRLHTRWFSPLEAMGRPFQMIVVGGDNRYPPFEFTDAAGRASGFNSDLTREIAKQMGLAVDIRLGRWSEILAAVDRGEIDMLQGLFYSPEREKRFSFSLPHFVVHHVIITRVGESGLSDLKGKSILVQDGDIMHDWALEQGYGKQLVVVGTPEEALRHLAAGREDCALMGRVQALYWIRKNKWSNLRLSTKPILSAEYCFAVPRGKEALLASFSEGLNLAKSAGDYRRIQTRWLGAYESGTPSLRTVLKISGLSMLPLLLLLLLSLAWSRSLRVQVAKRTQALQAETEASRAMAAQLERTATELKRSNSDLEQFAYVSSHDLKEPLRMVTGFMSLLREHSAGTLDDQGREYIALAEEGGARMQQLVDDLLAYSRVGRKQDEAAVDTAESVQTALKNLKATVEETGAAITCGPLPVLRGSPTELIQLFQNLIGNALKFRGNKSPDVHIGAKRQNNQWLFSVKDNGIGIEPEYLNRIFMIFQRLHASDEYPGTGIGLAICKKIVERHGGHIWAESEPGCGTTFFFTFPS